MNRTLTATIAVWTTWAAFVASPAAPQAEPLDEPTILNVATAGSQDAPAVAVTPDGGFAVVWRTREAGLEGISAQWIDPNGAPRAEDVVLEAPQAADDVFLPPRVASQTDGELLAVWTQTPGPAPEEQLKLRRFTRDGTILGDLDSPVDIVGFPPLEADLAPLAGGVVVAWFQGPDGSGFTDEQVLARIYPRGEEPGPEFVVNSTFPYYYGRQESPSVAAGGAEFVVVWEDQGLAFPNQGRSIVLRRFSASGDALGPEAVVVPFGSTEEAADPRVASDAADNAVVVWEERTGPQSSFEIWARRFPRSEELPPPPPGALRRVHPPAVGDHRAPDIAMHPNGNFVVVWRRDLDNGESIIEGRLFNRFSLPEDAPFLIARGAANDARPSVALSLSNRFLVVWHAENDDTEGTDIFARRYSAAFGPCFEDAHSMCLQQNRFRVEVAWRDFQSRTGSGTPVSSRSADSGLFWFFSANNWEILVKVLNGCSFNDFYWVFVAASTNVEYTVTVTDTLTGEASIYANDLGVSSPAFTDTAAFATCGVPP